MNNQEESGLEKLRKASAGWRQMMNKSAPAKQKEKLNESKKQIAQSFEDDNYERPTSKQLKESYSAVKVSSFIGSTDQVMTKLSLLFTEETDMGIKHKQPKILKIEEIGLNKYRVEYIPG